MNRPLHAPDAAANANANAPAAAPRHRAATRAATRTIARPDAGAAARLLTALFLSALLALALLSRPARAETEVQVVTSPGGIEAWLVQEPAIPMLALEIRFDTGARFDPAPGAMNFLSAMLDEGAGGMEGPEWQARAQTLALRYGFSAGINGFSVSAKMLTENLDESVEHLRLALAQPRFDAAPLGRMRDSILSGLRGQETDPAALASRAWRKAVYGEEPEGRPLEGTMADVEAIDADDLRAARLAAFNRRGVAIGAVGDIDAERLGALLDRLLGDLPDAPLPAPAPYAVSTDGRTEVVEFDTPQAVARLVGPGIRRHDPDFFAAYVMNHVLGGGGFSARLMTEVREKRGLTYGVWSYLDAGERTGAYVAGVSSDNARIAEAVAVIKAEWARMAAEGPTEEELALAKRYLTGAYPLRFDSNGKIAGQLAGLKRMGFAPDYIRTRNARVEAVTLEDAKRVAARLLDAEALYTVVVGKPEGLDAAAPPAAQKPGEGEAAAGSETGVN